MNFGFLSLTFLWTFSNLITALRVGEFISISGLVKNPELNGSIAIVQKVSNRNGRYQILKAEDECIRNFTLNMDFDDCMKPILIKEANMGQVNWNIPEKLPIEQIYLNIRKIGRISSYVYREVTGEEREVLDRVVLLIRALCNDKPSNLRDPTATEKLRLIGAWINQNFDYNAMVYVSEARRALKYNIEWIWHGIGVWFQY